MGLVPELVTTHFDDGTIVPESWCVVIENADLMRSVLLAGFGSKVDALIACAVLGKLEVDWALTGEEWDAVVARTGLDWKKRMELVCEHLRW